jgi:branched-chain amino acid transport system permease protein
LLFSFVTIALLALPFYVRSPYVLRLANVAAIWVIVALGLHFILGMTGQISIGHAAFFGIGAYTSSLLTVDFGCSFWLALPASCLTSSLFGVLLGFPAIKIRTHYLALVTIGFQEIFRLVMMNWTSFTHGASGVSRIPPPLFFGVPLSTDRRYYYLVLPFLLLAIWSAARISGSSVGRTMRAVKEREVAAQTLGINIRSMKVLAFTLGAAYAGIGGSLYAHLATYINPDSFTLGESINSLIMLLIGGIGSVAGAVIGAVVITLLPEALRFMQGYHMLVFSIALVALMIFMPKGLIGIWYQMKEIKRGVRWPLFWKLKEPQRDSGG